MGRLTENSIMVMKNKSYSVTAEVEVPKTGAQGVIIAQGGCTNGWSLYAKDGKLKFCYNFLGVKLTFIEGTQPIRALQRSAQRSGRRMWRVLWPVVTQSRQRCLRPGRSHHADRSLRQECDLDRRVRQSRA
jgi:hypothetical protein